MTYYPDTLTFTNSKSDNLIVYVDGQLASVTDFKAQERAMRVTAVKYICKVAFTRFAQRMELIRDLLNTYGV